MADGNWTAVLYIDNAAGDEQSEALRAIFSGEAGGPWEILGQFFRDGKLSVVRKVPLEITIDATSRTLHASDRFCWRSKQSVVQTLRAPRPSPTCET
jgi:hypothetical protein